MKLSCVLLLVLAICLALANGKSVGSSLQSRVEAKKSRYNGKQIQTSSTNEVSSKSSVVASDSKGVDLRGPLSVLG
jgi:hypothetical protein